MFEIFVLILFCWLFIRSLRLAFRVTWGLAKITAVLLLALALPMLVAFLLMAGGILLLLPVLLIGTAFSVLRTCNVPVLWDHIGVIFIPSQRKEGILMYVWTVLAVILYIPLMALAMLTKRYLQ